MEYTRRLHGARITILQTFKRICLETIVYCDNIGYSSVKNSILNILSSPELSWYVECLKILISRPLGAHVAMKQ